MYTIFQDPDEELVLLITPFEDDPEGNPLFLYDGSDRALLFRSFESAQLLKGIPQECVEFLKEAADIFVIESDGKEVIRDYMALVEHVDNVQHLIERREDDKE